MGFGQIVRRWGLALVLALTALIGWQVAEQRDVDLVSTERIAYERSLTTPILSARRIPRTLQAPVADDQVAPILQTIIDGSPSTSCVMVQVGDRTLSPSVNIGTGFVPASNQKIVTTWAAVEVLGPDFRFTTRVRVGAEPVDGVVAGNLYLVGGGDPFLTTADWWEQYDDLDGRFHTRFEDLVDRIVAEGITEITGSVIGDETAFDTVRQGPWDERLIQSKQSGPLSALTLNEGFTTWPSQFQGSTRARSATDNPPLHAASVLTALLQENGVTVGAVGAGQTPQEAFDLVSIESPPLTEVITHVNSYSSNIGAELLLKQIGLVERGEGSTAAGANSVQSTLIDKGIPSEGVSLFDGSGLAETDRLTCQALVGVLHEAGPDSPLAQSLAIGGERGTLALRFVDTPAESSVWAKTGTLNDATALSGFVRSAEESDRYLTFAYVANESLIIGNDEVLGLQDTFVVDLTGYPGGPALAELSPRPPKAG